MNLKHLSLLKFDLIVSLHLIPLLKIHFNNKIHNYNTVSFMTMIKIPSIEKKKSMMNW